MGLSDLRLNSSSGMDEDWINFPGIWGYPVYSATMYVGAGVGVVG